MTKQELIDALEALKDSVNDGGKHQISTFQTAVRELVPDSQPTDAIPATDARPTPSGFMGRRSQAGDQ